MRTHTRTNALSHAHGRAHVLTNSATLTRTHEDGLSSEQDGDLRMKVRAFLKHDLAEGEARFDADAIQKVGHRRCAQPIVVGLLNAR